MPLFVGIRSFLRAGNLDVGESHYVRAKSFVWQRWCGSYNTADRHLLAPSLILSMQIAWPEETSLQSKLLAYVPSLQSASVQQNHCTCPMRGQN